MSPLLIRRMSKAPNMVPMTAPRPPNRLVPRRMRGE
jgi:hypothetical protein